MHRRVAIPSPAAQATEFATKARKYLSFLRCIQPMVAAISGMCHGCCALCLNDSSPFRGAHVNKIGFCLLVLPLLSGCASDLRVWDAQNNELRGVPFRAPELYKVRGVYNIHTELGSACTPAPFEKTVALPTGSQYFANVRPAQLSKSEFGMTFSDGGSLASITMNTQPAGADTINAVTTALSTLLPFAGVTAKPPRAPAVAGAQPPGGAPACDTGPGPLTYEKFVVP